MPMRQVPGLSIGSTILNTDWEDDSFDTASSNGSDSTTDIMANDAALTTAHGGFGLEAPSMNNYAVKQHQQPAQTQHQQPKGDVFPAMAAIQAAVERLQRPGQMKATVPLQGMGNGVSKQMLTVWLPETLFVNTTTLQKSMPCPHCASTRNVDSGEWPSDFFFVHDEDAYIAAKQYSCQSCQIVFRGWHPKTLQALPREIASQFPVREDLASEKFAFLSRTMPLRNAMHPQPSFGDQTVADPEMLFRSTSEFSLSCQSLPNIDIDKLVEGEYDVWPNQDGAANGEEMLDGLEPLPLNRNSSFFTGGRSTSIGLADLLNGTDAASSSAAAPGYTSSFLPSAHPQQHHHHQPAFSQNNYRQQHPQHMGFQPDRQPYAAPGLAVATKPADNSSPVSMHSEHTPPFSPESQVPDMNSSGEDLLSAASPDASMAHASMTATRRSIQFCSVCFGVRRQSGQLVAGHRPDGFCPVKKRKATTQEKRELRRRRQKMRRAIKKRKTPMVAA
ncbi:Hypothetical Protein FCC1311_092912 [Hondaea fermentalgiana]|uniref:Uncharacterized protein n=1 Tax=Hondaea fermentalgiana TaxID=2315210 RepID=A0A2R5GQD0_9STRA|nr:Hypothetical Protein FCC1311_092912 [Hondaea fermentalgiana]|eukprot:GBG33067.1 Hypothetical Protein FCC1311_092912 [Hondaea fermentalgiana]